MKIFPLQKYINVLKKGWKTPLMGLNKKKTRNLKLKTNNLFKRQLALFEANTNRIKNLDILFYALLTLKPTSVESEHVFQVAGKFSINLRNRMSDGLLNALIVC